MRCFVFELRSRSHQSHVQKILFLNQEVYFPSKKTYNLCFSKALRFLAWLTSPWSVQATQWLVRLSLLCDVLIFFLNNHGHFDIFTRRNNHDFVSKVYYHFFEIHDINFYQHINFQIIHEIKSIFKVNYYWSLFRFFKSIQVYNHIFCAIINFCFNTSILDVWNKSTNHDLK